MFESRFRVAKPPVRPVRRVIAALLVGLLALVAVPSPSEAQTRATFDRVIVLGDSWSAGIGLLPSSVRSDTTICRAHSDHAFPHGVRFAKETGAELLFAACNGSTVADVRQQALAVAASVGGTGEGTLIVLSAGGNDIRSRGGETWPEVLEDCILRWFGDCGDDADNEIGNLWQIERRMTVLIELIESEFPDAKVRVIGYPELMHVRGNKCHGEDKISPAEADFIDANARMLNTHLRGGVEAAGWSNARFVESIDAFEGHGVCASKSSDRWIHGVVNWWAVSVNSFHPNQAGYDAFHELLVDSLPIEVIEVKVNRPSLPVSGLTVNK